jgi:single-strand DNA-binding protein
MNSINITGRLAADPELRSLPSGDSVCKLRLAVENLAPNRETAFINVTCFRAGGQAAARVLSKGWLVAVSGRLAYDEWQTAGGAKRHDYEVIGSVDFLAAPRGKGPRLPSLRRRSCRNGARAARGECRALPEAAVWECSHHTTQYDCLSKTRLRSQLTLAAP